MKACWGNKQKKRGCIRLHNRQNILAHAGPVLQVYMSFASSNKVVLTNTGKLRFWFYFILFFPSCLYIQYFMASIAIIKFWLYLRFLKFAIMILKQYGDQRHGVRNNVHDTDTDTDTRTHTQSQHHFLCCLTPSGRQRLRRASGLMSEQELVRGVAAT